MTYRLVISPQVSSQLADVARWYRETSGDVEVAEEWFTGFLALLQTLTESADRHSLAWEADDLGLEIREVHYGSGKRRTHRALFRIQGDIVEVLAVRHHAQREVTRDDLGLD